LLDETTSALDAESEAHVYALLKTKLPDTTLISIGHRPTIDKYHDRIVTLKADKTLQATVDDQRFFNRGRSAVREVSATLRRAHSAPTFN
jgi:ABC-type uncharacterized transport system fused permease/ATPase subunit